MSWQSYTIGMSKTKWQNHFEFEITWKSDYCENQAVKTYYKELPREFTPEWIDSRGYIVQNGEIKEEFVHAIGKSKAEIVLSSLLVYMEKLEIHNYNIRVIEKCDIKSKMRLINP